MVFLRHPSWAELNRFADGELSLSRQQQVSEHLTGCSRCRRDVAFIRQTGELARSLDTAPAPEGVLERVLERRAEGDRVLLPLESPGAKAPRRRAIPVVAAAAVLLVAGIFATTGLLEADHGGLWVEPERPRAGELLTVRYDDVRFADEDVLHLKARYRTEDGRYWEQIAGVLERGDDAVFSTPLQLPDSVVYAAFVVEDIQGQKLDSNNERLWDLMVHARNGRPTRDALWARMTDHYRRGSIGAREAAHAMTELYPESPLGWAARYITERPTAPDADAFDAEHLRQFRRLERILTDHPPADPDEVYALAFYAAQLGDLASSEYWLRRAEQRDAQTGTALSYTARSFHLIMEALEGRPAADALRDLEEVWQAAPFAIPQVSDAWIVALMTESWESAMRWLPRYLEARGAQVTVDIIQSLLDNFPTERVVDWIFSEADSLLFAPTQRSMALPRWLFDRRLATGQQAGLALVAEAALETGDRQKARALAYEGLELAWHTPSLESIGEVLLETGDTANATVAFARAAADPVASPAPDAVVARPDWTQRVANARAQLSAHVLRESVMGYPGVDLSPTGRPAVVTFRWSCRDLDEWLDTVVREMPETVVHVVLLRRFGEAAFPPCDLPVIVHRDRGQLSDVFRVNEIPSHYVLDAQGRIRFEASREEFVVRQLAALQAVHSSRFAD